MAEKNFIYPLKIFIGYDQRQPLAYTVAHQSLMMNSSHPVAICPLILGQLPISRRGLTEFTFSRYLVPYLCDYEGEALFIDADVLVHEDVSQLFCLPWNGESVKVVKNAIRFEWPSVMLFNNSECKALTKEFVENANPQSLEWGKVGELPKEWNYLIGYEEQCGKPKKPAISHFTQGLPCFKETKDTMKEEWEKVLNHANSSVSWEALMGNSVHKKVMGI